VTKTHPAERILPVLDAGHRVFGENRVQEAKSKWPELRARYSGIELHLIGALQTNKVRDAVALFDLIHSLDRLRLAEALKTELENSQRTVRLFVQVNTGEEPQKGGLLRAQYGKGTYIYTGYAFFRQLPAGVPGAVRLFVNILSAGHEKQ